MREASEKEQQRRRWRHAADSEHTLLVASYLLNRQFTVMARNRPWAT